MNTEQEVLFARRKDMIREMIYDKNYIPLKMKELAYMLGVRHEERGELKEVMDALVRDGSVELTPKGKYIKPENRNYVGTFTGHARGFGFVTVEGQDEDIFIPAQYVNGAFHKDRVRVKVASGKEAGKRREGMILKILERGAKTLVGTFDQAKAFGFVVPDDEHFGKDIFIGKKHINGAVNGDKVVVSILEYGDEKRNPEGRITEVLGPVDDPATDVASIIKAFGIEEAFPSKVLREVLHVPAKVEGPFNNKRKDFRSLLTVTIDGEDARDLDDAITLERAGDGYRLGVHIADVAEYVKEGSALDAEACERGTSVYLTDRVIPMLPRELSNGICSLNAGEERLCLSCIMDIDAGGQVTNHVITEGILLVDRRMSYTGVQAILDGKDHPEGDREDIREMCFLMKEAAAVLKEKRRKRGSINFDFPESKIILDEKGYPEIIKPYERNTATDIIEDFMLLANETVAEDYFWQELPFLFRIHEAPDAERLARLQTFIRNFGYIMKTNKENFHPKEVQKLLFALEGEPEEPLISRLVLRSMQRAKYSTLNAGHFGLSTQYYTHFTSPIRRYPDLQIHRIIKEGIHGKLNAGRLDHYDLILPEVAAHSSEMERRAQDAEREVEKLKKVEYMQQHLGETFSGVISGVTSFGFFVDLDNTVEGLVSIYSLTDDEYIFSEAEYKLTGRYSHREFALGQRVEIIVADADKKHKTIDFILKDLYDEEGYEEYDEDDEYAAYDEYEEGEFESDAPAHTKEEFEINDWIEDEEVSRLLNLYSAGK